MSDREPTRQLWLVPAATWIALLVLFAISLGTAYLPLGAGNIALNLFIAAVMVALLVAFLMDLRNSTALLRTVAFAGPFWLVLMFALTFSDYLSRSY